jgi:hypothetical protein
MAPQHLEYRQQWCSAKRKKRRKKKKKKKKKKKRHAIVQTSSTHVFSIYELQTTERAETELA